MLVERLKYSQANIILDKPQYIRQIPRYLPSYSYTASKQLELNNGAGGKRTFFN